MESARPQPRLLHLLLLLGSCVSPSAAWELVLLHTNDVHARVEETSVHSGKCGGGACFGGVARRSSAIQTVRAKERHVLLLDAGDQFQGTVWFNYYKGAEAAHFMNNLNYDAMVFGNHEFDNGVEALMAPFMKQIKCPLLSANIRATGALASTFGISFLPYKILTVGGEKVGVVGYTSKETPHLSQPGPDVLFEDEVSALQRQVDKLLALGVQKVVALGHSGFTVDQQVAREVRGVDVVIGGHSNTFLYSGPAPSSEVPAGPYPFMVQSADGRQVPVVQAYAYGKYLGYLKVTFDKEGNVLKSTGNPILLDSSVPQDPIVLADVEEWKKKLANYSAQVLGSTLVFLNGSDKECRFRECNLGNLICDAMVDNSLRGSNMTQWNHVSASIFNGGGVRTSIDERSRNGSITAEDLISVLPFGGTFDLVQLKGSTLLRAFEHSVKRYGENTGEFLQVSGFRVEFDLSRPADHRVKSLAVLCTRCRVPLYQPVRGEEVYMVVLPSYMVTGGDGFSMIAEEMLKHDSGSLDLSVVSDYITRKQKVYPAVEGRVKIYNSASGPPAPLVALVLVVLLWTVCWTM
uniref:LOW QUALITY PROTEIN: 5'-nucleotidase n=1 Tax=Gasterosteus aculeatus aculeatus TaxID=481459 RepID=UPI001A99C08A|nr:LOW QUALITY PROTEIN: 5'-nucleotidase [Gasterosteus aculeatus aculeatus]